MGNIARGIAVTVGFCALFIACDAETIVEIASALKGVVISMDTLQPIGEARIYMKNNINVPDSSVISGDSVRSDSNQIHLVARSDAHGLFSLVFPVHQITPNECRLLVVTTPGYSPWKYTDQDTIFHLKPGVDSIVVRMHIAP